MDDITIQVNIPEKILEEVLGLQGEVKTLASNLELVRVEQVRQGAVLTELLEACRARAKLCGIVTPRQHDRTNGE